MTCQRLEAEGMLGFLGEKMDPHVEECADCRGARASYARIAAALARESTRPVPDDWMDGMRTRLAMKGLTGTWPRIPPPPWVAGRARGPASHRRGIWIGGAAALTATVAAVLFFPRDAPDAGLRVAVEKGQVRYRAAAEAKHTGDVLSVEASAGDADHFELRVYQEDDRLVLRCPGAPSPACTVDDHTVRVSYTFATPGRYEVYWLVSGSPLPGPAGSLDLDMEAAFDAGAAIQGKERLYVD